MADVIEQQVLAGDLQLEDLPEAWDDGLEILLGIRPPDDRRGCLQDIHWSAGLFGYFPTYALGNMYAAQFFAAAESQLGDQSENFAAGRFHPLLEWLRKNIHHQGQRFTANRLVEVVSGDRLSTAPLMAQLNRRFRALYGL